jgi:hypothetical protein
MISIQEIERIIKMSEGSISLDIPYDHDDEHDLDTFESIIPKSEDTFDRHGWEQLFHTLTQEQLELLICMFLGMTTKETIVALQYPSVSRFYNLSTKLKQAYQKQKGQCLGYNDNI